MAKRFNVSIPDALAERMEPFKNDLSLSALMQDAIERELTRLTMSDADKELREGLKAAAISAWIERLPGLGAALATYADHLFELAAKDGQTKFFKYYRAFFFLTQEENLLTDIARHQYPNMEPEESVDYAKGVFSIAKDNLTDFVYEEWIPDFAYFVKKKAEEGTKLLDDNLLEIDSTGDGRESITISTGLDQLLQDNANVQDLIFKSLDSRIRQNMAEADIYKYVLDIDEGMMRAGF